MNTNSFTFFTSNKIQNLSEILIFNIFYVKFLLSNYQIKN